MADSKQAKEKEKEEQARKAHALAEKCFLAGNVSAARQWMQSAVRLAPNLPGTPQIVAAYDVHAAAAARSPTDWYAVLGLNPGDGGGGVTHDNIKKQHRRLCLLVHPDKNPCAAADGAFMLVQAASHALLAKHPPPGTAAPAPAAANNQPTPPPPPPQPQRQAAPPRASEPKPRPRPQVVQMPRRSAPPQPTARPAAAAPMPPTYSQQAKQAEPTQKGRRRRASTAHPRPQFTSPIADKCPVCGAKVTNGRSNYRCMSCQWSPMDDYDDDLFDY